MSCKITQALAPNGKPSEVYNNISKIYMAEIGLTAQLHIYSEGFKSRFGDWENGEGSLDENGEPQWRDVLKDVDASYSIGSLMAKSLGVKKRSGANTIYDKENGAAKFNEVEQFIVDNGIPATAHLNEVDGGYEVQILADVVVDGFAAVPPRRKKKDIFDNSAEGIPGMEGLNSDDVILPKPKISAAEKKGKTKKADTINRDISPKKRTKPTTTGPVFSDKDMLGPRRRGVEKTLEQDSHDISERIRRRNENRKAKKIKKLDPKDLKDHRFANLLLQLELRIKNLNSHNTQLQVRLQAALDNNVSDVLTELTAQINRNNSDIETYKDDIIKIENSTQLVTATYLAERDLKRIKDRLDDSLVLDIEELQTMDSILNFWRAAGEFANVDNIIFTADDLTSNKMKDTFRDFKNTAEPLAIRVDKHLNNHFTKLVNSQTSAAYGNEADLNELTKLSKDIGEFAKNIFHVGRTDNRVVQAIYKKVKAANVRAGIESTEMVDKINSIMGPFIEWADKMGIENPFDVFKQRDSRNKETGNIVTLVSEEFNKAQQANFWDVLYDDEATKEDRKEAYKWDKENTIMLDPRKLFPKHQRVGGSKGGKLQLNEAGDKHVFVGETFTDTDRIKHINELKEHFGEEMTNRLIAEAEKKVREYSLAYDGQLEAMMDEHWGDDTAIEDAILKWEKDNSPFYHAQTFVDHKMISHSGTKDDYKLGKKGRKYSVVMPRKFKAKYTETGSRRNKKITLSATDEKTEWMDKNFQDILNDPKKLEIWTFYTDTMQELNKYVPPHKRKSIKDNSVIAVQKSLRELFMEKKSEGNGLSIIEKVKLRAAKIHSDNIKSLRTGDYSTVTGNTYDPATNKKLRYVNSSFARDNKEQAESIISRKEAIFMGKHKRVPTDAEMQVIISDTMNELSQQKSFDLQHVLSSYAQNLIAYKHKAAIEAEVHLAADIFKGIQSGAKNSKDEQLTNKYGKEHADGPMKNYGEMVDHFMDNFDNFSIKDNSGETDKDMYTKEEQREIDEINQAIKDLEQLRDEGIIDEATATKAIDELNLDRETIGGKKTWSKYADKAREWVQIKTMGWNFSAATINLMFGQVANWVEAGGERFYKSKNFNKAWRKVAGSRGRTGDYKKLNVIAHKMSLLQSNLDIDAKKNKPMLFGRDVSILTPYDWGNRAEFMNQMPVAVAIMLETMVEDGNGGEISIYDALDDDGKLLAQYRTPKNIENWESASTSPDANAAKIAMVSKIHEAIITIHGNYNSDAPVLGKRKWYGRAAFQFKSWLPEAIETRFGKEHIDPVTGARRKGRYVSIYDGKTINGDSVPALTMFVNQLKAIVLRSVSEELSDVDIRNLKSSAREAQVVIGLILLGMMMSALHGDDDEDDAFYKFALNTGKRLLSDMIFFADIESVSDLAGNAFAVTQVITDVKDFGHAVLRTMGGDGTISSGINEGQWRVTKELYEGLPLLKQLAKFRTMISKEITTPGSNIDLLQDFAEGGGTINNDN